ncbi:MAG: hypothetical protein ACP5LP_03800 [Candidatus Micrarchaeia archaeon]
MLYILLQSPMTANAFNQSYAVPQPYSFLVAILIIALTLWLGYVFIKDIIKVIFILIGLYLLASIGYSFLTTGMISLSGISNFTASIIEFFKFILSAPHIISNATKSVGIPSNAPSNALAPNSINSTPYV